MLYDSPGRSRPIGVRVCPVAQFNFLRTAFGPHKWTMVVFWKENSGRQPQLIAPENEGDNTNCPSPPTFFDDTDVPYGPGGPPAHFPEPHEPPDSPDLPPGSPAAPSPAGGRERVGTGNTPRERLHPRPSPAEPQLIPLPMSAGEDDQPPQDGRQRQRSRSRERVHPHVQVPQKPQIQPMVTPEPDDDMSDEDFKAITPSSPSVEPPPSAEQRGRSRRDEGSRSRERKPPHSSSHASQQPQPVVPHSGVQQTQTVATQGADEDSATVDPPNRVSDRSRSPQDQEDSRRQGPKPQKGKKTVAGKQPSTPPKAKKHKSMESDEDGEEHRNELGTSSNSQPTRNRLESRTRSKRVSEKCSRGCNTFPRKKMAGKDQKQAEDVRVSSTRDGQTELDETRGKGKEKGSEGKEAFFSNSVVVPVASRRVKRLVMADRDPGSAKTVEFPQISFIDRVVDIHLPFQGCDPDSLSKPIPVHSLY